MKRGFILLSFLIVGIAARAQGEYQPKYTWNVELGLPVATSNQPFRDIMQGLVTLNTYQQYSFPFHLNVGLGVKYSYFTVDEFAISQPIFGGLHTGGAFAKVGWDKFYGPSFGIDFGVKMGYAQHFITTEVQPNDEPSFKNRVNFSNVFVEPVFSLILKADERNSYRFNAGYTFYGFPYEPVDIGLESNGAYTPDVLDNSTQYFFVGFGYSFYFGEKVSE
ncbi:MAG: hypothetical protein NXI10_12715 [bacterium]|nr:hypothetical protein [bacterium]